MWVLVTPFLAQDLTIQQYFPTKTLAFLLAVIILWAVVFVALSALSIACIMHKGHVKDLHNYTEWKYQQMSSVPVSTPILRDRVHASSKQRS